MQIQNDHFVCVSKKTKLFVCHFDCSVVHSRNLLDRCFKLFGTELNLRVGNCDLLQLFSLDPEVILLASEIV